MSHDFRSHEHASQVRETDFEFAASATPIVPKIQWSAYHIFQSIIRYLKEVTFSFIGAHIGVYIVCMFILSIVIYLIENFGHPNSNLYDISPCNSTNPLPPGAPACGNPISGIFYVDALFLALSGVSASGLLTVDFSAVTLATQIVVLVSFVLGSALTTPIAPAVLRLFLSWRNNVSNSHEYQALRLLLIIIGVYMAFFLFIMSTFFAVYCVTAPGVSDQFVNNNINSWYGGYFLGISSFINAGFSPFNNSVMNFQPFPGFLIWVLVLNLLGNVYFPLGLRFSIWLVMQWTRSSRVKHLSKTLLTHSRHYFMLLFTARHSVFILVFWAVMYVLMFFFFLGMEWNNPALNSDNLNAGQKFVSALFQSMQLRNNGFNCQNLGYWGQAIVVFALMFMYIGSYPEVVTVRSTVEVHMEEDPDVVDRFLRTRRAIVSIAQHLALQSAGFLFIMWLLILVVENQTWAGSQSITLLFEIISAFGVVGMSLGQPTTNYSYSGSLTVFSKLLIMLVMLAGRHRGLPLLVDSAIKIRLRPFSGTHVHLLPVPGLRKTFQTKESTSNLGVNYTLEGERLPAHYHKPLHPVLQDHHHAEAVAHLDKTKTGEFKGVVTMVELGARHDEDEDD